VPAPPPADEGRAAAEAEREGRKRQERREALRRQAEVLLRDGALSEDDRKFLELRGQELGLGAEEAQEVIAGAAEARRRLLVYRSYVEAFLADGVLDATESELLEGKRAELEISEASHADELSRARQRARGEPRDVLQEVKGATPDFPAPPLERFGRGVFDQSPALFTPPAGTPPPDSYVIGPGDEFLVTLWGRFEAESRLMVDGEGVVQFPRVGPVRVGGLAYADARALLKARAESITGVTAAVTLSGTRSVQVFVVGEAQRPGSVTLTPLSTVIHAVMAAGGPTPLGSLRQVLLRRSGKVVATLDLYDFIQKGETRGDRPLENGDVVVLPKAETLVRLQGRVKRPAIYELRQGEGLRALLQLAGGLEPDAFGGRLQVERAEGNLRRTVLDVAFSELAGDVELRDGDLVRVFPLDPEVRNQVTLLGHVYRPGAYAFTEGMRVADLLGSAENLKPDVDLTYGVVLRETGPDRARAALPFRPGPALEGRETAENLALRPRDEVYIFSRYQFRPPLQAQATGELRSPGLYRIPQGARVADLVRLAGGLGPEALLRRAQLLRYLPDRSRETLYIDLGRALDGDPAENRELAEQDHLIVHSVWDETFEEAVQIDGEVKRPGRVPLTRGMTVRELVFKAGGLTKNAYLPVAHLYRTDRRSKEVTIHTFRLEGALEADPNEDLPLHDQDHVVIHSAFQFAPVRTVSVSGQVNAPGTYPHASNMRVRDLVLAAGGLKEQAYLAEAEVVRTRVVEGEIAEVETVRFSLERALAGDPEANLPVGPWDKLFVKTIPEWRETWKVELAGEVRFPGTYYIFKGERLSSVLERAGGYTSEAYLRGAVFTRESAREQQQRRLDELRDTLERTVLRAASAEVQTALSPEDVSAQRQFLDAQRQLLQKLQTVRASGRVVIRALPLDELRGTQWDVVLEDGDALTVPKTPQTVAVVGEVYNPTSLLWEPDNRRVEHYLQKTGGPTPDAEARRIYVVRADGTVVSPGSANSGNWWSPGIRSLELLPGDTVLVPEKVIRVPFMKELKDITQVLFQIAVTAGVAVALF
jgi:protein involved in polysaccharide export with SLBB domain